MNKKKQIQPFSFKRSSILVLLLLGILFGTIIAAIAEQKGVDENKAQSDFQVKIPDGLYLYKPDFSQDAISPLVLVKNGKLYDPYTLTKEMGMPSFTKAYITNKTFYAYVGSELYGKVSDLNLISDSGWCITDEFVLYIRWVGRYEGKPLPHGWLAEKIADGIRYHVFGSTRVIFAPQKLPVSKKTVVFQVTERDMEKMVKAVQKNLIPAEIEQINERLKQENRKMRERGGRLEVAEAFDIDGNGKKDLVGVYYLYGGGDICFILWDSGKIEKIDSESMTPAYVIGGIIDLDLDGVQELILGTSVLRNPAEGDDGMQIDILRHGPSGWTSVYRPKWICGPWCSDIYN